MECQDYCKRIALGDKDAFSDTYVHFRDKLYHFIYSKTHCEYLSNEIVQLTFIKVWKNRTKLNTDLKLSTQIFQIAKTTMIDVLRKESKHSLLSDIVRIINSKTLRQNNGYEQIDEKEMRYRIHHSISMLPPIRRKVFLLSRFENLSYREISTKLDISERTVDKHIELAMKQLKRMIACFAFVIFFLN